MIWRVRRASHQLEYKIYQLNLSARAHSLSLMDYPYHFYILSSRTTTCVAVSLAHHFPLDVIRQDLWDLCLCVEEKGVMEEDGISIMLLNNGKEYI